ncbi:hypothetical protein VTI74DRAFT_6852 [Chaetomium olivicolor]
MHDSPRRRHGPIHQPTFLLHRSRKVVGKAGGRSDPPGPADALAIPAGHEDPPVFGAWRARAGRLTRRRWHWTERRRAGGTWAVVAGTELCMRRDATRRRIPLLFQHAALLPYRPSPIPQPPQLGPFVRRRCWVRDAGGRVGGRPLRYEVGHGQCGMASHGQWQTHHTAPSTTIWCCADDMAASDPHRCLRAGMESITDVFRHHLSIRSSMASAVATASLPLFLTSFTSSHLAQSPFSGGKEIVITADLPRRSPLLSPPPNVASLHRGDHRVSCPPGQDASLSPKSSDGVAGQSLQARFARIHPTKL